MKIAILSDIHDQLDNLQTAINDIRSCNINTIIICGDIVSIDTLKYLAKTNLTIFYTLGNAEIDKKNLLLLQNEYKNLMGFDFFGEFTIEKKLIAITHFPNQAKKLAQTQIYDFVFYGHTHTPWVKIINNTVILNPGEIASHLRGQSTYAQIDLESGEYMLKILC